MTVSGDFASVSGSRRVGLASCAASVLPVLSVFRSAALLFLVLASLGASAPGQGGKPFRAARLTYIDGDVRVEQARSTANSVAVLNMPLVEGSVVSAGADGQAEIEFEDGSLARLTPHSGLSLVNLSVDSSGTYQTRIALLGGLSYLELRAGTKYVYSVDAGGDLLSPVENATIRVNLDEAPAVIAVLDGSVHVSAAGGADVEASAGQTVRNDPGSDGGMYMVKSTIAPESWDRWNEDRDEAAANEEGTQTDARAKFAGNQGYGWSDLDANGSWYDVPGHGQVWQPDIAATPDDEAAGDAADQSAGSAGGFDPYGYGSWAWTPAGYSWASGYAWGWLPYRCGQWVYYDGFGWGWSPSLYCGTFGFGGYGYGGYGYGLNLGRVPVGYRRPYRPIPGPGPVHPILRGHGGPVPVAPVHRPGGERVIAGTTVQPLQSIGTESSGLRGVALGAGLRRDYPVDTATHAPVMGAVAAHGSPFAGSNARAAVYPQRPAYQQPARGGYQGGGAPYQQGGGRAVPQAPMQPVQRQSAPSAPRSSPTPAPASHSAASAASAAKGK